MGPAVVVGGSVHRQQRSVVLLLMLMLCSVLGAAAPAAAQDGTATEATGASEGAGDAAGSGDAVIRGTLVDRSGDEPTPLEGVEIVIVNTDTGEQVGTATSDAEGVFELAIPGDAAYSAELVVDTLPEGLRLRNPGSNPLEFDVGSTQSRTVLFPVEAGEPGTGGDDPAGGDGIFSDIDLREVLQLGVEGIKFGLIIAICSIGLSLIFGTTGLVNFAHGELVTFGALTAYFLNAIVGLHLIPAALIALVIGGLGAGLLDRGLWRPLRRRGTGLLSMLVVSIGLSLFLRYLFLYLFGGRTRPYEQYAVQRAWDIGPVAIAPKDLFAVAAISVVLVGVGLMLNRTRIGKAMRAVSDNRDLAESSGIDVERVILFVWILGGVLATLGGVFFGLAEQVSWQMGFRLLLLMFAGVILGGLGTAYGAFLGSLLVGLLVQLSALFIPNDLRNVMAFFVLIIVLLVRPQGLLGRRERVG